MAFVNVVGPLEYPYWPALMFNTANAGVSNTLDAAADFHAWVIQVPQSGTLEGIHFMMSQQTSIENLHISFQDVVAVTGLPDNVVDEFRIITPVGGDLNSYRFTGIMSSTGADGGVKRVVTKGDKLAIVIKIDSFSAGDIDILEGVAKTGGEQTHPYGLFSTNSGTAWTIAHGWPAFALEYETDGIVQVPNCVPLISATTASASSATSPDEFGIKFQVPIDMRVRGIIQGGQTTGVQMSIENAGGTTLAGPIFNMKDDTTTTAKRYWEFGASVDLSANTDYYIVWTPGATSRSTRYWNIEDAAIRAALPFGTVGSWNERVDAGAWTEFTSRFGMFALMVEAFEDGAVTAGDSFLPQIQMAGDFGPIPVY
jgi:hypothetical protein